ncbi:hypothetical protein AHAS_Ahas07G0071400 [Arachis hypogaea]
MEKNLVSPFRKETEVLKFSEDTPASHSELDREGRTDASENGTTQDQQVLRLLGGIREHLDKDKETTKALLQSHGDQIKKLTEVVEGHSHILGALIKNVSTKEDHVPGKKDEGNNDPAKERRGRPRKTSDGTKKTGTGVVSRRTPGLKSAKSKTTNRSLKRKLHFEEQESSTDVMLEVQQQGHGTPFTYYTHSNAYMDGAETPKCMKLLFPPPEGMEFVGMELAVAAYVFWEGFAEEVYQSMFHDFHYVVCVISLVAVMCTEGATSDSVLKRWWLPTSFQQIAVNPTNYCPSTLEYIKRKFMGKADQLFKVYIPLHTEDHWYLMIIDFFNWKLVYLDSLKDSNLTKSRKDQMLYVAFFLENLLCDDYFYEGAPNEMHKPSTYEILEPEIGQQAYGSNDCGVWVAQWMIQSHLWSNYDLPVVNEHTRMRLAIDIVLGRHNPYRAEIGRKAVEYWDKICRKSSRKTKKMTDQVDVTTSPTI